MQVGTLKFLRNGTKGDPISQQQMHQSDVVAIFVTRAALHLWRVRSEDDIGVEIEGRGERVCRGGKKGRTRNGFYSGGCRLVWRVQLQCTRLAICYLLSCCNDDVQRKYSLYWQLWAKVAKIVEMECVDHCWENMENCAKVIHDAPLGRERVFAIKKREGKRQLRLLMQRQS